MTRVEKLVTLFNDNIDCALITSDYNRLYFTGMKSSAGVCVVFRDSAFLLIDSRYYEKACDTVKDCTVILIEDYYAQLCDLIKKHNAKNIAVETKTMTVSEFSILSQKLKHCNIISDDNLSKNIELMRSIKTLDEIEKIRTAQKIAEKAFDNVLNYIEVGKTDKEIAFELDSYMLKNGAEAISFETIALSGAKTSVPHGVPTDKKVEDGDFVLMDFGAVYDGYHSDMTRTVCVGQPTMKMDLVYNVVLNAQLNTIDFVHEGITGKQLDSIARDFIDNNGFGKYFGHGLGHSVGLEIHEVPTASMRSESVLASNVIMTIEPGIYLPKQFGVRIEDMVVVTESGCENLTEAPKQLIIL